MQREVHEETSWGGKTENPIFATLKLYTVSIRKVLLLFCYINYNEMYINEMYIN